MTMMRNHKRYIGTVCHAKHKILQAPGSDVSLEIPKGSSGVYVMGVHTDVSTHKHIVADEECFVSPVVEIEHKSIGNDTADKELKLHTLRIPHCLKDKSLLQDIRVRRGKLSSSFQFHESLDEMHSLDHYYFVDNDSITISTYKFSEFVCTTCNTTCHGIVQVFLFGKLNSSIDKTLTTVKIKSFLCSPLFKISEFRDVSCFENKLWQPDIFHCTDQYSQHSLHCLQF